MAATTGHILHGHEHLLSRAFRRRMSAEGGWLSILAPAKINLHLSVGRRRDDGYCEIRTLVALLDRPADYLRFTSAGGEQSSISCEEYPHLQGSANIVWRAAELLRPHLSEPGGFRLELRKNIPLGAGLGGGSSDAAATLLGLDALWRLSLSQEQLHQLASRLGSDVPLFLYDGPVLCSGRGTDVQPLGRKLDFVAVLICPQLQVSTAEVYNIWCRMGKAAAETEPVLEALRDGSVFQCRHFLANDLQAAAFELHPVLAEIMEQVRSLGAEHVQLTGSGAAMFALCESIEQAERLCFRVKAELGLTAYVVRAAHTGEV